MSRIEFRYNLIKAHSWASSVSGLNQWILKRLANTSTAFILAYHWISFEKFTSHLRFLQQEFQFCSLDHISETILRGRSVSGPRIAVTFDDGIGDVIENAIRVAQIYQVPMTFFLPTYFIDTGKPYWFMELPVLVKAAVGHCIEYKGKKFTIQIKDDADRTCEELFGKIASQRSKPAEIENSLSQIRSCLPSSVIEAAYKKIPKPIGWQRVYELSKDSLVCFGSHTVSHPFLLALSKNEISHELVMSREKIQDVTGKPVQYFCYPYGAPDDIGPQAPAIARRVYDISTTMIRGAVKPGTDRAYVARIPIYERDSNQVVLNKVCQAAIRAIREKNEKNHFMPLPSRKAHMWCTHNTKCIQD